MWAEGSVVGISNRGNLNVIFSGDVSIEILSFIFNPSPNARLFKIKTPSNLPPVVLECNTARARARFSNTHSSSKGNYTRTTIIGVKEE